MYAVYNACCIYAGELGILWAIQLDDALPTSSRYYRGHRGVNAIIWSYTYFNSIASLMNCSFFFFFFFKCGGFFGLFGGIDDVYTEYSRYISAHHFVLHSITNAASIYTNSFLTWLALRNPCAHEARLYLDIYTG